MHKRSDTVTVQYFPCWHSCIHCCFVCGYFENEKTSTFRAVDYKISFARLSTCFQKTLLSNNKFSDTHIASVKAEEQIYKTIQYLDKKCCSSLLHLLSQLGEETPYIYSIVIVEIKTFEMSIGLHNFVINNPLTVWNFPKLREQRDDTYQILADIKYTLLIAFDTCICIALLSIINRLEKLQRSSCIYKSTK